MAQIPALFQPWPPEQEPEEYDVIFIPNENLKENNMLGDAWGNEDYSDFTFDDGTTISWSPDGSVDTSTGEIGVVVSDPANWGREVRTVTTNPTTGTQTTTTINTANGTATQVTTGLVNGVVSILDSVTKVVNAVKGTGKVSGNIYSQPIGTAIPQANGTVITRNANGTLTTFDPRTGQTSTTTLPGQAGGLLSGNNLLIIGVLAIGAIALSRRK
jgi:hypothetical protein